MTSLELTNKIKAIAQKANAIVLKNLPTYSFAVNYVCVFARDEQEFAELTKCASKMGNVVKDTDTGPIYKIDPLEIGIDSIQLIKIRQQDSAKSGLGYVDYKVDNYEKFKAACLQDADFKLTIRPEYEFIGLYKDTSEVGVYFADNALSGLLAELLR